VSEEAVSGEAVSAKDSGISGAIVKGAKRQ
jgi:hypothetical protein